MYTRLNNYAVESILDIGGRILPRVHADERLAEVGAFLGVVFEALRTAHDAADAAEEALRVARALQEEAVRKFGGQLREFGMVVLCAGGNRHDTQPYTLFFPDGYGALRRLGPPEMIQFAGQILSLLEPETDPKLVSYRAVLRVARDEFVEVERSYEAAAGALADARALEKARKKRFVRALGQARMRTASICDEYPAYVRGIFSPAGRRHDGRKPPEDGGGTNGGNGTNGSNANGTNGMNPPGGANDEHVTAGVEGNKGANGTGAGVSGDTGAVVVNGHDSTGARGGNGTSVPRETVPPGVPAAAAGWG
jgi:hypothetical protein